MKHRKLTSVLGILVLILVVGLACNIPSTISPPQDPDDPTALTTTPPSEVIITSDEVLFVTGSGSVMVSSGEAGVLTTDSGAQLEIPNGAVPPAEDGSPGTAQFSMEEDFSKTMELVSDFAQVGPVYRLLPEGTAFGMPVKLTLPIPSDVDAGYVMGIATFDEFSGTWQLLPAAVDEAARTVVAEVGHFSLYGLFGLSDYLESREGFLARNGGWFYIKNTARDALVTAPFGKPLPASVYYGVCVQAVTYDDPRAETWSWQRPTDWMIGATAQKNQDSTRKQWLPAGTYTLMEMYGIGETNNYDIFYYPEHRYYVRPMGQVVLGVNEQIQFYSPIDRDFGDLENQGFIWSKHPCWMKPMDKPPVEPGDNWTELEVINTHRHMTTQTHFGKRLPAQVSYGVCSPNRIYDDPLAETWNWRPPLNWMMIVTALKDRDASYTWKLPAGNYSLLEVYHLSEENTDWTYNALGAYYYRPLELVTLVGGQTNTYTSPVIDPGPTGDWGQNLAAGGFSESLANPCGGSSMPTQNPASTFTPTGTDEPTDQFTATATLTHYPTGTSQPTLTTTPTPDPTDAAYVGGFEGSWDTNWGIMDCTVTGTSVHCEYTWDQGRIDAVLSADGRTMEGQWAESPSYAPPDDGGRVVFTLSDDGYTIDGSWGYGQNLDGGPWTGTRR
jgi:hypothetical protein